jgi:hypothetical protein
MKKLVLILLLGVAQLCLFFHLKSVQKGSETVVSIEPQANFSSSDTDNKMLAFGWFRNGFTLEDLNTSCTFDSAFPVSGTVDINGGSIYLTSDMHLENITVLNDLGKFYGDGHIITLDSSVERLINSNVNTTFKNVDLYVHSDLQISTTILFEGDCYVNGRDRRMTLDPSIEIIVGKNSTLTLKNINLIGLQRTNIRCFDDTGTIILDNSACCLDGNYNFTVGSLQILNNVDLTGSYTFFYDSSKTLTIHKNSKCTVTNDITLGVRVANPSYGKNFVWFDDETSEFEFTNSSIIVGTQGILLSRGTVIFDGKVNIDAHSTSTANGLIFGTGIAADDILVKFYPAARVNFNNSHLTYNLTNPNNFQSTSSFSKVIRGSTSCFYIKQNIVYSDITITVEPTSTILVDPGTFVNYDNCTLNMPTTKFSITGARYNTYTSILDGNDEIFISDGVMPLYTLVQNTGNAIKGNGDISGAITLYNSAAQLTFNLTGQLLNYVVLNGGKVILSRDLEFAHDKIFVGSGTINLSSYNLKFGINNLNWAGSVYWDGNSGSIELNSDIALAGTWTFSGNCKIKGNNNMLMFGPSANIIIERGSTLSIENLNIYGLKNTNMRCLDDAGKIALDNSAYILSGDYNFENGKFTIDNLVHVEGGPYTFGYTTKGQSTINPGGIMYLDESIIFNYEPSSDAKNLIQLGCPGSKIVLDRATLHSTCTGIQLTKGILEARGNCYVSSDATCSAQGIMFGDGISAGNDLSINVLDASKLELTSGYLVMKNLN